MLNFIQTTGIYQLFANFTTSGWKYLLMILIAVVLLYLALNKGFEPLLLIGIALGMLLTNLPGAGLYHVELWDAYLGGTAYVNAAGVVFEHVTMTTILQQGGILDVLYIGVKTSLYPCLIFIGIGAMADFGPLIANPKSLLLGGAAQIGIFITFIIAGLIGFNMPQAAAIGNIGGANGPATVMATSVLAPELLGAIAVAAYSYMSLVPLIQPPIMRLLTTKKERRIVMEGLRTVSKKEKIIFDVVVIILSAALIPDSATLIGCLMFGNILHECGLVERLSKTVQNEMMNISIICLSISVGATTTAERFLTVQTLGILALGMCAFALSTAGGVLFAKFMNLFLKHKINPLIGSAGVAAVPMAARVSQQVGQQEDPHNFLLMHAMGPNVAGTIGSAVVAGFFMKMLGG